MTCKLCGLEHRGWVSCAKAAADQVKAGAPFTELAVREIDNTIANTIVANKRGVYKDKEKRLAYMRELMRKRRAK